MKMHRFHHHISRVGLLFWIGIVGCCFAEDYVCSSRDGPFCPLINGLDKPSRVVQKTDHQEGLLGKVSVISGATLDEAFGKAKTVMKEILKESRDQLVANEDPVPVEAAKTKSTKLESGDVLLDLSTWTAVQQSSVSRGHGPSFALDTVRNTVKTNEYSRTKVDVMPFWQIDFLEPLPVSIIEVWNPEPENLYLMFSESKPFGEKLCKSKDCRSFQEASEIAMESGGVYLPTFCSDTYLDPDDIEYSLDELGMSVDPLTEHLSKEDEQRLINWRISKATVCVYEFEEPVFAQYLRFQLEEVKSMRFSEIDIYVRHVYEVPNEESQQIQDEWVAEDDIGFASNTFVFNLPIDTDLANLGDALKDLKAALSDAMTEALNEVTTDISNEEKELRKSAEGNEGESELIEELVIDFEDLDDTVIFGDGLDDFSNDDIQKILKAAFEILDLDEESMEFINEGKADSKVNTDQRKKKKVK
mmetsp:Transcript_28089/g.36473  ORF Transcript_28089/g.36473 Transcript_28089/m.36473 type:complete len:473 (-) Transcript_28089:240-1658(-)